MLRHIARALVEVGGSAYALQTAQTIADAYSQAWVLHTIGTVLAESGEHATAQQAFAQALEAAQTTALPYLPVLMLRTVVAILTKTAEKTVVRQALLAQALKVAPTIERPADRATFLNAVAIAQAKAGEHTAARHTFLQAVETAREILSAQAPANTDDPFEAIALAQAEAGESAYALETVEILRQPVAENAFPYLAMVRA